MNTRTLMLIACTGTMLSIGVGASAQEKVQTLTNPVVTEPETPPAATENAEKPKQQATNTKLRDPNEVICKKSVKTSTRLRRKKICKTRARWDEERSATRDAINEVKSQTRVDRYD